MRQESDAFKRLSTRAYLEFVDVGDYIWKTPRFIDSETELEKSKLRSYFPRTRKELAEDPDALKYIAVRWALESNKLKNIFPRLMAVGNMFMSVSLFETYCLSLCKEIEHASGRELADARGMGMSKIYNFFERTNIRSAQVPLSEQIRAALKLRNCLVHAGGQLTWSREAQNVRSIVERSTYLSKAHQARKMESEDFPKMISILQGDFGDELQITNDYAFVLASYLRDHFCELCRSAQSVYGGEDIDLPSPTTAGSGG